MRPRWSADHRPIVNERIFVSDFVALVDWDRKTYTPVHRHGIKAAYRNGWSDSPHCSIPADRSSEPNHVETALR